MKEICYIGRRAKEVEFCTYISFPKFTPAVSNAGSFTLLGWLLHLCSSLFDRCSSTAKQAKIRAVVLALDAIVLKDMILWSLAFSTEDSKEGSYQNTFQLRVILITYLSPLLFCLQFPPPWTAFFNLTTALQRNIEADSARCRLCL